MGYVTPEQIAQAKEIDLLTYLQRFDPHQLVHVGGSTYCTREHDSLKISNGKWNWFSQGIGGRTALDYLIKVQDVPFTQAVEMLVGRAAVLPPVSHTPSPASPPRKLLMPELNSNNDRALNYLMGRGIHPVILDYCLEHKLLAETKQYHKPASDRMFTEKYGTHQCMLAVRENVMRTHHATVDDSIINRVLRFGTADIQEDYLNTIRSTAAEYVREIFRILREREYNPALMRLYVLGGGSCLIRNFGEYDADRVTINEDISMPVKVPQSKPPPRPARHVSPAEWAWLDRINRQLAYDEYMQAKREFWLAEHPPKRETG